MKVARLFNSVLVPFLEYTLLVVKKKRVFQAQAGEIIPRVWTRVRVEDRVRLRVRLRVGFRVGFQEADSGHCCLVGPGLLEVYLVR